MNKQYKPESDFYSSSLKPLESKAGSILRLQQSYTNMFNIKFAASTTLDRSLCLEHEDVSEVPLADIAHKMVLMSKEVDESLIRVDWNNLTFLFGRGVECSTILAAASLFHQTEGHESFVEVIHGDCLRVSCYLWSLHEDD